MTTPATKATIKGDLESFNSIGNVYWTTFTRSDGGAISQADYDQLISFMLLTRQIEIASPFVADTSRTVALAYSGPDLEVPSQPHDFGLSPWLAWNFYDDTGPDITVQIALITP